MYGGNISLLKNTLPRFGITATFVDPTDIKQIESADSICLISVGSTNVAVIPNLGNVFFKRLILPPYIFADATTWSP